MDKLMQGLKHFQQNVFPAKRELFEKLAHGQRPGTMFITCADSRVVPDLFTHSEPGELFVIRNAGNIVPPFGRQPGGVTATIEFAVVALGIRNIVVCGHSDCGAMKGLLHPEKLSEMPTVATWLQQAEAARRIVADDNSVIDEADRVAALTEENVVVQLRNLQTHPSVATGIARGEVKIYGWVYQIGSGQVDSWDGAEQRFVRLDGTHMPDATPPPRKRAAIRKVA